MSQELIETLRRAKGNNILPRVALGTIDAETLILRAADVIEAQDKRLAELQAELGETHAVMLGQTAKLRELEAKAQLAIAELELLEALKETMTSLIIAGDQALEASKTDPRWLGVYEKIRPYVGQARAAIAKAEGGVA